MVLGLAAGVAGALALTRVLATLLYHVSPTDPLIFAMVALGLMTVAFIAMLIPGRRATGVNPIQALRSE